MMDGRQTVTSARRRRWTWSPRATAPPPACPPGRTASRRGVTAGYERIWNTTSNTIVLSGLAAPVKVIPSTAPLLLVEPSYRGFGNDHWHGQLRFLLSGGNVGPVNIVSLDNYVRGIVPCEESPSWPIESLKAPGRRRPVVRVAHARTPIQSISAIDTKADARTRPTARSSARAPRQPRRSPPPAARSSTYQGSSPRPSTPRAPAARTSSMQASWGSSFGYPYLVPVTDRYDGASGANEPHLEAGRLRADRAGPQVRAERLGVRRRPDDRPPSQRVTSLVDPPQGLRAADAHVGPGLRPSACARPTSGCWA